MMCVKSESLYFGKECDGCGECELDYEPDYDNWIDLQRERAEDDD